MNRNLYRIVFNVKRGQLMAVAETASSQGKHAGEKRGFGASGGLPASLHPVCFAVLATLGMAAPLTQAQIIADPSAPGSQRPTILAAPNGVPLVNITTPTAAGVSRNTYSQFDVQRNGVILNNSRTHVQTQLGGWVQGNPYLATGSARVIVNEVNSANPILLRGYVEVAGPRTEIVIANPAGIQVDGAGFINVKNATLTTGTPVFNGGSLDSYRVQGGTVSVAGLGLDASTTDKADIFARALVVNAGIWANQLRVTTGSNEISAADSGSATPISGTGPTPTFMLDMGLLGGMYTNHAHIVGTEYGVGANLSGFIGATVGDAIIQSNGWIGSKATIQAQGNIQIQASGNVSNSGPVSAGQTLKIETLGALDNSAGSLSAPRLDISAASLVNRGGSIEQTGSQALSLQGQSVSNAAGGQIGQTPAGTPPSGGSGTAPTVTLADGVLRISGALNNDAGRINAAGAMDLSTSNGLNNDSGTLSLRQLQVAGGSVSNQGGTLRTQGDMRIDAGQVQNQGGGLTAAGQLQLSATGINNQGGEIVQTGTQDTAITVTGPAGVLDNTLGRIASKGQNLALSAQTVINTDGKLEHAGAGALGITANTLSGQRGQISGNAAVNLSAAAINQDGGSLTAAQLTVNATTLSNRVGQVNQSGTGQASITASQSIDNTGGAITSKGDAVLSTATLTNSQGRIAAEHNAGITAGTQLNNTEGALTAGQNLTLAGGTVNNTRGTLQAGGDATLNVGDIQNTSGSVYAGANLNTNAANVSNTGSFYAAGEQALSASGSLTSSGVVASQGNTRIDASTLQSAQGSVLGAGIKADGTLAAGGKLAITATQSLAANGQVLATGNAALSGASVDLSGSQTSAANITATATAGDISTRNATVSTAGTLSLTAKAGNTHSLDNSGGTLSAGQLALDVANLNNQGGQIFQTGTGDTAITLASPTGTLNNSSGYIAANAQNLGLAAQTLINTDGKIEHTGTGNLGITATTLTGQRGQITGNGAVNVSASAINHDNATLSAQQLNISTTTLSNRAGQISQTGTGPTTVTASQSIDNTDGAIASNGNTTVSTATLDNTQGRITTGQSATVTTGTQLNNTGGVLAANQGLMLAGGGVNNTRGTLQAGGSAMLTAGDIQNTGGSVYAGANLGVNAANVGNTGSMYAAGNQTLNASGVISNSGFIAAQGDTTVRANSLGSAAGSILGSGIKANGTLAAGGNLNLSTTQGLAANGQVLAAGNATLSGGSVDLSGSQVAAANITATATSGDITTRSATVSTAGALSLTARANNAQTLNNSSGTLNAGQLNLDVANLNNQGGQIVQTGSGDTTIALTSPTGTLDNTSGRIAANSQNLALSAQTLTNTDGKIEHAGSGTLGLTATTVNGQRGQINSLGALSLNAGAVNHDSASTTAQKITIATASLNNHAGQIIQTGTDATSVTTTGALDNTSGTIASNGNTSVSAQSLNNQGGRFQSANTSSLNLTTTGTLDNSAGGQIAAGGATTVNAGTLNNNLGKVTAGTTLTATVAGAATNAQGLIAANGAATVNAANLDNTRGGVASVQNTLQVTTTGSTTNDSGRIEALGAVTLTNAGLSNTKAAGRATAGSITGNTVTIQSNGQALNNAQGTIAAVQGATLQTGAINNDKGLIHADGALGINTHGQTLTNTNAAGYANGAGGISSQGAMTLDTAALNNAAGFIGAKGALTANTANVTNTAGGQVVGESTVTVTSTGFDNQGGQVQALGDASITAGTGTINNTGGLIRSAGTASLGAANVLNSNTLGANLGLEGNNVAITANTIANDSGALRADNNATLTSSGTVNNNAGLISAGNTATVQDNAANRSLAITNAAGTIIAGQNANIKAASLGGDGKVLSRKDLNIDLSADFNNTGEVSAATNATVTTLATLSNNGTLQAGATLDLTAATINNGAAGKMAASTLKLTATDVNTLINRGLIDSVNTQINTVTLNNLGTGRIYGDTVGIAATTVNNDAENGVAGTIAARQRLDIGAATVNNSNGALIFSGGTGANALNIGGSLDASRQATGLAQAVNNAGGTIESLGGLTIAAAQINNTNPDFAYTLQSTPGAQTREYITGQGIYTADDIAWELGTLGLAGHGGYLYADGRQGRFLLKGAAYSQTVYKPYYGGTDAYVAEHYVRIGAGDAAVDEYVPPAFSYSSSHPVWAVFGMVSPGTGMPGPKPVGRAVSSGDGEIMLPPDPVEMAAWNAATAPWLELQSRINSFRATVNATAITFDGFRDYSAATHAATITRSTPGRILSGSAMTLNARDALINDQSQIIAGGALNVTGQAVDNRSRTISVNAQRTGTAYAWSNFNEGCGGFGGCDYNYNAYRDAPYVQDVPQTTALSISRSQSLLSPASQGLASGTQLAGASVGSVSAMPGTIGTPSAAARSAGIIEVLAGVSGMGAPVGGAPAAIGGVAGPGAANYGAALQAAVGSASGAAAQSANGASAGNTSSLGNLSQAGLTIPGSQPVVIRTVAPNTVLPTASLFRTNPNPATNYIVETDPQFSNYRNWLSSDYLLTAMSLDPAATQKRLGDGFYEQRLVNEQVALLTGRRFLDGYSNEETQYQALMDAGKTFAQQYQLRPGIVLSAAQMAALTSDIVWLVEQTVTLPDGSKTLALVPQVYARAQAGDLDGAGTLLAGKVTNLNLTGGINNTGTVAGRSIVNLTAENVNNLGGRITGNTVNLAANNDLNNIGGQIDAANSLNATAGRDLNIASTTSSASNYTEGSTVNNFSHTGMDRIAGLYVTNPNGTLVASAGRDVNVIAGLIQSQGDATVQAVNNLNLGTVATSSSASVVRGVGTDFLEDRQSADVGSQVQANGRLSLSAGKDINAKAANVQAGGDVIALAGNNINIANGQQTHSTRFGMTSSDGDLFSSSSTTERRSGEQANAMGSSLGGKTITAVAGNDLTVTGSNVISDAGTLLSAGNNLTIQAATNTSKSSDFKETKEEGLISSGGVGVTIGSLEQSLEQKRSGTTAAASTVGAIQGNANITAGKQYTQTGSDALAPKGDINITAQSVEIKEARETSRTDTEEKSKQSGITVGLSNPLVNAVQAGQQLAQAAGNTSDGRSQALAVAAAALKGYNTYKDLTTKGQFDPAKAADISVTISLGSSQSESKSTQTSDTSAGSTVGAGGNVSIKATGAGTASNLTVQGSAVRADGNVTLEADNQVNLLASRNTATETSSNSSSSGSIGVSLGTNTGVSVSASKGSGSGNGSDTSFTNSTVSASNTATIKSGGDTHLHGATVSGNQVKAEVGGNLNIASQQDTSTYTSQQSSSGGSLTFGTGGVTGGGISSSKSNIDSNFASVGQQSGIRAGDGGFQVNVQGNTDLKGGVISSTQAAMDQGRNSFNTGSLTLSDIQNSASYEGKASGISIDVGQQAGKFGVNGVGAGIGSEKGSASSISSAGISGIAGNTAVRTGDAETGIGKIFDAAKVQASIDAQVQIMQAFTKEAPKAVGSFAQGKLNEAAVLKAQATIEKDPARASALTAQAQELENTWGEGKPGRVALHALVGLLTGDVSGAVGAATSQSLVPMIGEQIAKMDLPAELKDAMITVAGTAIGAATGGTVGAISGLTATANNYLMHNANWRSSQWGSFKEELARCKSTAGCDVDGIYKRWTEISNQQQREAIAGMDAMFGADPDAAAASGRQFGAAAAAMNMNPTDICGSGDAKCYSFVQQQNNQASAVFRYGITVAYANDLVEMGRRAQSGEKPAAEIGADGKRPVRTGDYDGSKTTIDETRFAMREMDVPPKPGSLRGEPEAPPPNARPEQVRSVARQNEAAETLSKHGYDVEQLPNDRGSSGTKQPDLRINGAVTDVYSPSSGNVQSVWDGVNKKANPQLTNTYQTPNVVVNLADSTLSASDVAQFFQRNPVNGLKNLIILKNNKVTTFSTGN